jgi:hypothetical protein
MLCGIKVITLARMNSRAKPSGMLFSHGFSPSAVYAAW